MTARMYCSNLLWKYLLIVIIAILILFTIGFNTPTLASWCHSRVLLAGIYSMDARQKHSGMTKIPRCLRRGTSFEGLSLNLYGSFRQIRDQIALSKGGTSQAQVLTRQREIATNYSYYASVGIGYTFGSIYNNVVNSRFGNDWSISVAAASP